jgi:histidine triad (HIT) family protein
MGSEPSIFTKIINGDIPSEFVYKDDVVVAIKDINPQAPFHVLIIPREPIQNTYDITEENANIAGHMMLVAAKIAVQEDITTGFRLLINNGADANQEVMHLHMHMLAGVNIGPMVCK